MSQKEHLYILLNRSKLTHELISLTRFHLQFPQSPCKCTTSPLPQTSHTQKVSGKAGQAMQKHILKPSA